MQRETTLSIWCERIIEAGWLLALALIPLYFNLFSARHFEPDKATTLRALVLVMAAAGLVRTIERLTAGSNQPSGAEQAAPAGNPLAGVWRRFSSTPLAVPALVYAVVYLFTTFTSVVPGTSFWGSYQRLQGTYTNLSYVGLFAMIVVTLRRREQLERIITVTLLSSLAVGGYGIMQHYGFDPLPWKGDVIERVASTMGNAIFVAAYMLMVVPFALYRTVTTIGAMRSAEQSANPGRDLAHAFAALMLVGGTLALLLAALKFGAIVRTADFRYWWVLPSAISVAVALWAGLSSMGVAGAPRERPPLWPAMLYLGGLVFFALFFAISAGAQVIDEQVTRATDWWLWLLISAGGIATYYGLTFTLPPAPPAPSRLSYGLRAAGALLLTLVLFVAIFFTQSRGPWLGLFAALFVFITLLIWQGLRYAQAHDALRTAGQLRIVLTAWSALSIAAIAFLITFNLSNAPFFEQLRQVPYLGRLGQLLEADTGTGLVRRLIWSGDEHAGGAIQLITSNPLRAIIGWGPESMFVAFNPFYPPSLTSVEARGASPDRSHQALLDEMVTRGVIGLISYFFVLISALTLCWRLMRRSAEWFWQVFFIACLSTIVGNVVEGLTGIPVVSTLMMFWVAIALAVTGGALAGHYRLGADPAAEPTPAAVAEAVEEKAAGGEKRRQPQGRTGRKPGAGRTAAGGRRPATTGRATSSQDATAALATSGLIALITLGAVWWLNLRTVYADMRFQEGLSLSEQAGSGASGLIYGMEDYLATIRNNPREDFYYLNLGRTLMSLADLRRQQQATMGEPNPDARVEDLLALRDVEQIQRFVTGQAPSGLMSYAEAVLKRAMALSSLNKDHYANLGRLNNVWYTWTGDPARLQEAAKWYEQVVTEIAPQDVTLLNEYAGVLMQLGEYSRIKGDGQVAEQYYGQAEQLLEHSQALDARYLDTDMRTADLARLRGNLDTAVDRYVELLGRSPHQLDAQVEQIALALTSAGRNDLLQRLYDGYISVAGEDGLLHAIAGLIAVRAGDLEGAVAAYQKAVALQPNSVEFRRNYTLVLSDTRRYAQAIAEAEQTLALSRGQVGREQEAAQLEALIAFLQQKAGGGS